MTFAPSPQQSAIFAHVKGSRRSLVVEAGPGAGKTKTIERCLPLIPESKTVHLFAFNTTIARELQGRIDKLKEEFSRDFRQVRASTFHSTGFGAIRKHLGSIVGDTDGNKCKKLVREWLGEVDQELYSDFICKLVSLAKGQGIGALVPDTEERWYELIRHHDLFLDSEDANEEYAVDLARQLLKRSNDAAKKGSLDFDDQLYCVILWRLRLWQNDFVFVDEAQDTNPVRRALAKLALRPGGKLVAVADQRQAIYGFTGASADAVDLIRKEFDCDSLKLTVSYRCAKAVVESCREVYPDIDWAEGAKEGKVEWMAHKEALAALDAHDVILCRNTAPLVEMAFTLIAQGRGCTVLGKEIGNSLVNLIKKMKAKGIPSLLEKLDHWSKREQAKFMARGEEHKAEGVKDRVDCILTVIENLDELSRTVPQLIGKIEGLFSDHNGVLTLCTIHKAKGKEWTRVAILRPDLMPSKFARQEHQMVQERNLDWVARSRAMEHLIFMIPPPKKKPEGGA